MQKEEKCSRPVRRRRKQRSAQDVLKIIAGGIPPEGIGREDMDCWEPVLGHELSIYETILATQVAQALEGDLKSAQFVRDTLGDKPGAGIAAEPGITPAERALLQKISARLGLEEASEK